MQLRMECSQGVAFVDWHSPAVAYQLIEFVRTHVRAADEREQGKVWAAIERAPEERDFSRTQKLVRQCVEKMLPISANFQRVSANSVSGDVRVGRTAVANVKVVDGEIEVAYSGTGLAAAEINREALEAAVESVRVD